MKYWMCVCDSVYMLVFVWMWVCFTVKLVQVQKFLVQNATTDTAQARWASVKGATGYRLTWESQGNVHSLLHNEIQGCCKK